MFWCNNVVMLKIRISSQKESCYRVFRQESFSRKQMCWKPSKIKDFHKLLEG
jgi:hypothetical protein